MRRYRITTTRTIVERAEYYLDAHDGSHARRLFVECGADGLEPAALSDRECTGERVESVTDDGPARGANAPEPATVWGSDSQGFPLCPDCQEHHGIGVDPFPPSAYPDGASCEACGESFDGPTVHARCIPEPAGPFDHHHDCTARRIPDAECDPECEALRAQDTEPPCPACGNECGAYLGTLGTADHYRCTACGATFSIEGGC